jgi:diguanylate cyclase (GGDEF)-like protein
MPIPQDELFFSRDEMLKILNTAHVGEILPILSSAALCSFVVIPRESRFFFSDGMQKILGAMAQQDVLLSSFLQFVPENERSLVGRKYETAFSDLVISDAGLVKIDHNLSKSAYETFEVEVHMQVISVDKSRYVVGVMTDKTRSVMERAAAQLFGDGLNGYYFSYDTYNDICYVSRKFVEDFDLVSDKIVNLTQEYTRYIHPDDASKLAEDFSAFVYKGISSFNNTYRFLSANRGEIHLRSNGFSDADKEGNLGGDMQFITGSFSDITEFVQNEFVRNNLIEGSAATTFYADMKMNTLVFSENIREIIPNVDLEVHGDIIEAVASRVISEDRKRFRDTMQQVADGHQTKYSVEFRIEAENDRTVWVACRGKSFMDSTKQAMIIVGTIFDLSQMNEVRENVEKNASCHELTGLPTREKLLSDAEAMIRNKDLLSAAIILIDVNGFHSINDRYGRSAGNEILLALSNMLRKRLPEQALIYHISIDTFCLLWPHASRIKVTEYMNYLQEESIQPLETGRGSFFITYGLSAAIYPSCGSAADELLVNAEIALHKVKQDKKIKFAIYSPVDKRELKERLDFELQIAQSIRNDMESFQLYYQPIINAKTEELDGAEALLRWIAPSGELVNPEKVVNALESTDQMESVGAWILDKAIAQCAQWVEKSTNKDFYIHINVTADDVVRRDFADDVLGVLARYDLPPKNILLEITETSLMKNIAMCRQNLYRLRSLGVRIALDDFGTGYSSFNYLRELPVDEIKIDKAFVDDVEEVAFNKSFISAITLLAHSIQKQVCVEGVETETQAKIIRELGADFIQGYYYCKPLTVFNFDNKYYN